MPATIGNRAWLLVVAAPPSPVLPAIDPGLLLLWAAPVPPAPVGGRDYTVAMALKGLLDGTGLFERVEVGGPADNFRLRAGDNPVALITLAGDTEDHWDTMNWIHRAAFELVFASLADEPAQHVNTLDRVRNVAANLVADDRSLGGFCIPGFTKFARGNYRATPGNPEHRLTATVSCAYTVPRRTGRDVTEIP